MNRSLSSRTCNLVGVLQLISALIVIPLSFLQFTQSGLATFLGSELKGSDRAQSLTLLFHSHGGIVLSFITLLAGGIALYVSCQMLETRQPYLLKWTVGLQMVLGSVEGLKLLLDLRDNWISIAASVFIVGYVLHQSGRSLPNLIRAVGRQVPQFPILRKKSSRL